MIAFPNAKINIGLYVTSRRADGYHNLSTVMVPVDWCDILEIVPSDGHDAGSVLHLYGREIHGDAEKNLCVRALRALEDFTGRTFDARIHLHKIVPFEAGLGAGSSDAAFTLKLLNDVYGLGIASCRLQSLAASIGADCPFFIGNSPMYCEGIGDIMQPADINLKGWNILIVKPRCSISTSQAYSNIVPAPPAVPLIEALTAPVEQWPELIKNDFETIAFEIHPQLRQLKENLYAAGAEYASMSGSGSAFYALFKPGTDNMSRIINDFSDGEYDIWHGKLNF